MESGLDHQHGTTTYLLRAETNLLRSPYNPSPSSSSRSENEKISNKIEYESGNFSMARKCRVNFAEIAAEEVAARTGGRDLATAAKRRKLNRSEAELSSPSSNYIQLRSRRIAVQESVDRRCLSSDLNVSCCLSDGSRIGLADLEAEDFETRTSTHFRRCESKEETTMCDCNYESEDGLDSNSTSEPTAKLRCGSTAAKMPTEAELEDFFAAAEKDLLKQFIDKYNYDIVKDEPLEGRYEWIPLKP